MRRRKEARPVLESMESKFLLSVQGVAATAMVAAMPLALRGSAHGQFSEASSNPDTGHTFTLSGLGKAGMLGKVQFSGHFGTPGFIATGHAGGTLTLSNPKGSVTLDLQGPTRPGFSAPPSAFTYTVVSGTGAYASAHGGGQLTVGLVASNPHGPTSLHHLASGRVSIQFA